MEIIKLKEATTSQLFSFSSAFKYRNSYIDLSCILKQTSWKCAHSPRAGCVESASISLLIFISAQICELIFEHVRTPISV